MPKSAGSDMKPPVRLAPRPQPPLRPIHHLAQPAPAPPPPHNPPQGGSNEIAAKAVRIASSPGGIR
jgi:hypothetical protein